MPADAEVEVEAVWKAVTKRDGDHHAPFLIYYQQTSLEIEVVGR